MFFNTTLPPATAQVVWRQPESDWVESYWTDSPGSNRYVQPKKGERLLSFEMELTATPLSKILRHFDPTHEQFQKRFKVVIDEYQTAVKSGKTTALQDIQAITEDYVLSPDALQHLPEEVRNQLTDGLDLSVPELIQEPIQIINTHGQNIKSGSTLLLGADGKPTRAQDLPNLYSSGAPPGVQPLPRPFIIAPNQNPNQSGKIDPLADLPPDAFSQRQSGVLVDRQTSWQILNERWAKLPLDKQLSLIQFERLHPLRQAYLITTKNISFNHQALRPDAPQLFQKLIWHRDGSGIEFKPARPVKDKALTKKWIQELSGLAGVQHELEHPWRFNRLLDFSFHLHYSRLEIDPRVHSKLVFRNALKIFHQGPHREDILFGGGLSDFNLNEQAKGMVRSINNHHKEVRVHHTDPYSEIDEMDEWYSKNPKRALVTLDGEIQKMVTPDFLRRFYAAHSKRSIYDLHKIPFLENIHRYMTLTHEQWIDLIIHQNHFSESLEIMRAADAANPKTKMGWRRALAQRSKIDLLQLAAKAVESHQTDIASDLIFAIKPRAKGNLDWKRLIQNEDALNVNEHRRAVHNKIKSLFKDEKNFLLDETLLDRLTETGQLMAPDAFSAENILRTEKILESRLKSSMRLYQDYYGPIFRHWKNIPSDHPLKKNAGTYIENRGWGWEDANDIPAIKYLGPTYADLKSLRNILANPQDPTHAMLIAEIEKNGHQIEWRTMLSEAFDDADRIAALKDIQHPYRRILPALLIQFDPTEGDKQVFFSSLQRPDLKLEPVFELLFSKKTVHLVHPSLQLEFLKNSRHPGYAQLVQSFREGYSPLTGKYVSLFTSNTAARFMDAFRSNPRLAQDLGSATVEEIMARLASTEDTHRLRSWIQVRDPVFQQQRRLPAPSDTCPSQFIETLKLLGTR